MVSNSSSTIATSQAKVEELLDAVRQEFLQLSQQATSYRLQNQKDFDSKINQQLAEMQQIRNTVYELELTHRKMKDAYEEELGRLKTELEQRDRQLASLSSAQHQQQTAVPSTATPATETYQTPHLGATNLTGSHRLPAPGISSTAEGATSTFPVVTNVGQPSTSTTANTSMNAAAITAPTTADTTTNAQEAVTKPETQQLVPVNDRSSNTKPIPPFLLDLDPQTVPDLYKKQTNDYYVLYNPALHRTVDVELHHSLEHTSVVCCVRFSNDGQFLATGCNKTTQVYSVSTGELVARLSDDSANHSDTNTNKAATTATATTISNDTNGNLTSNNAAVTTTSASTSSDLYIRSVCFSPDGKFLATGAEDRLIRVWDIEQRKIVMVLQGHEQDIYSLDYFPSGDKLVSGSGDRTVRIWDLKTGQCSLTLSIEDGVTTVAVSPGDGKYIAAGSLDRAVRIWDSETGFLVERLDSENELGTGHKDSVYSVVFTKDGGAVVSGSLDRTVKLWNLRNAHEDGKPNPHGTCEVTYMGHKDFVLSVATTQNDEYVLSGSKDRGVLFWDTKTGDPLMMLQGHRNSVISVAVSSGMPLGPEYGVFATGSGDCTARMWKFSKVKADEAKI